jgi:hypothetical protein
LVQFQDLLRDVELDVDLRKLLCGNGFYLGLGLRYFLEDGVGRVELLVFEVLLLFCFELIESLPDGLNLLLHIAHCFVGLLAWRSVWISNFRLTGRAFIECVVVTSFLNHLLIFVYIYFGYSITY